MQAEPERQIRVLESGRGRRDGMRLSAPRMTRRRATRNAISHPGCPWSVGGCCFCTASARGVVVHAIRCRATGFGPNAGQPWTWIAQAKNFSARIPSMSRLFRRVDIWVSSSGESGGTRPAP